MSSFLRERILVAVNRLKSFSRVADELGISQPTVSVTIRKMEKDIGGELFYRGERPIALTALGQMLASQYEKMLSIDEQTQTLVASYKQGILPLLRIGAVNSFSVNVNPFYIPQLLGQTQKLIAEQAPSNDLADILIKNDIDLAIINAPVSEEGFTSIDLLKEDYLIALPKTLYLPHKNNISDYLDRLLNIPFVYSGTLSFDYLLVKRLLHSIGYQPDKVIEVDCYSTMCQMINQGVCWSLMTPFALCVGRNFIDNIRTFSLGGPNAYRHFYFCHKDWMTPVFERQLLTLISKAICNDFMPQVMQINPNIAKHISPTQRVIELSQQN